MSRLSAILGTPREWAVRLTIGASVGAFFGVIGPFGSYLTPLAVRLPFWIIGFVIGVACFSLAIRSAVRAAPRFDIPEWFALGLTVVLISAPYSVVIGWMFSGFTWTRLAPRAAMEMYGQTLMLSLPFSIVYLALERGRRALLAGAPPSPSPAVPVAEPAPSAPSRPAGLRGEVIALQMEDHYVRAHAPGRSELVLMPMGQAIDALGGVEGMRVHRSWWVARSAVEGAAWEGRNLRLRLKGGLEAPVSRTSITQVRAAGWLEHE